MVGQGYEQAHHRRGGVCWECLTASCSNRPDLRWWESQLKRVACELQCVTRVVREEQEQEQEQEDEDEKYSQRCK